MKNLWAKFVAWFKAVVLPWLKGLLLKLKTWFLGQELAWIKKNWKEIANFIIILIAYFRLKGSSDLVVAFLVKIWLFAMTLYYVFIKGLEIDKLFKKPPTTTT